MRADLPQPDSSARFKSERAAATARGLRKAATPAERALWYELRRLPLQGTHFRRQAPFGPFVLDFVCHGARLAVEVDGGVHAAPDRALHDVERDAWIEARGYRVLRFENARVLKCTTEVAREIYAEASLRLKYSREA